MEMGFILKSNNLQIVFLLTSSCSSLAYIINNYLLLEAFAEVEREALARALGGALERRGGALHARRLGLRLERLVRLDAIEVAQHRARWLHVLDAHVNALDNLPLPVHLVDLDADGTLVDVPDLAGAAVVELVRHALLLRRVGDDVNHVAHAVRTHEGRHIGVVPLGAEPLREEVARARAVASRALMRRTHRCCVGELRG